MSFARRPFVPTAHCRGRMLERHVSEDEVIEVLNQRGEVATAKHGRLNVWGRVNGRRIRVTIKEEGEIDRGITVFPYDEEL